ncbi:Os09g0411050 [Oryza sativa Japonica Group]|uniref:Os09g0411050 protein n=1 Tax=Oryza sativa subsp. japonica TaxID=39947 RepID=A0A0P0XMK4_ORYSJ|nr:Os09g0411050 [Oryza sativa Japonica Group]
MDVTVSWRRQRSLVVRLLVEEVVVAAGWRRRRADFLLGDGEEAARGRRLHDAVVSMERLGLRGRGGPRARDLICLDMRRVCLVWVLACAGSRVSPNFMALMATKELGYMSRPMGIQRSISSVQLIKTRSGLGCTGDTFIHHHHPPLLPPPPRRQKNVWLQGQQRRGLPSPAQDPPQQWQPLRHRKSLRGSLREGISDCRRARGAGLHASREGAPDLASPTRSGWRTDGNGDHDRSCRRARRRDEQRLSMASGACPAWREAVAGSSGRLRWWPVASDNLDGLWQ